MAKVTAKTRSLVDKLGDIDEQIKTLQDRKKRLAVRLEGFEGRIKGEDYQVVISSYKMTTLVKEKVKKLLTASQYQKCERSSDVTKMMFSRIGEDDE